MAVCPIDMNNHMVGLTRPFHYRWHHVKFSLKEGMYALKTHRHWHGNTDSINECNLATVIFIDSLNGFPSVVNLYPCLFLTLSQHTSPSQTLTVQLYEFYSVSIWLKFLKFFVRIASFPSIQCMHVNKVKYMATGLPH